MNEALIRDSKPKAKKAKQTKEGKEAKAAKKAEEKMSKEMAKDKAKKEKEEARERAKKEREEARVEAKKKKASAKVSKQWSEEDDEEDGDESGEPLPWQQWVVLAHATSEVDGSTPFFSVAMYGHPQEEGDKEEWCERKDLVADGARSLIDKYIQEHANYPPYSDLLVPKRRTKEEIPGPPVLVDRCSPCDHNNYRVSFKMEDHPGFCGPGQYLHDLKCGGHGCERTFAANLKEVKRLGKDKASRPTADKPVYCCVNMDKGAGANREHECRHALCNACWSKAILGDEHGDEMAADGSRSRAVRAVTGGRAEV
jgi:hypothetical protein